MAGKKKQQFDPAAMAVFSLDGMDSKGYMEEHGEDARETAEKPAEKSKPVTKTEAKHKPRPTGKKEPEEPSDTRKRSDRLVQMYVPRDDYDRFQRAKTAYNLSTGKNVTNAKLLMMVLEKGLKEVDADAFDIWNRIEEKYRG